MPLICFDNAILKRGIECLWYLILVFVLDCQFHVVKFTLSMTWIAAAKASRWDSHYDVEWESGRLPEGKGTGKKGGDGRRGSYGLRDFVCSSAQLWVRRKHSVVRNRALRKK